ncbi:MAG: LPS-assembly protein LptD [Gammaproteobacteria bacterium]|nr:LPS-assembly protein LptD [Gammaproteobacteria bacterium]MBU1731092.1 LPS-assembly protein LptD [Gammaproteobacteria bacterium]MBU1894156.1 LPS-assembly protein LptD [Gammaproteobacteria bacterium]
MRTRLPITAIALLTVPVALHAEEGALELRQQTTLISNFPQDEQTPIFLDADRMSGQQDVEIEAEGEVELRKRGQVVNSDRLIYRQAEDEVHALGNVRIEQQDSVVSGPELKMKLDTRQGYMRQPVYQMTQPDARGAAENLDFVGENKYNITDGTYTTCSEGNNDWFVRSSAMELDRTVQVGTAHHASVVFKGVPILYTPWLQFPLNNQRKSGFLPPTLGSSGKSGAMFALPYYWNIAPERDATLTPRILSKRGLQLRGEYRYLDQNYAGTSNVEYLPNDSLSGTNRYNLLLNHGQLLGAGWSGGLNVQKVSDDNYFRDLNSTVATTSQVNLPREGTLAFNDYGLSFLARVQSFQTLQDPLAPITPPYSRLPQLLLNGVWRDFPAVDLGLASEWTDFRHPTLLNGQRFSFYPSVSLPLNQSFAFVTPKIGVHHTRYALSENNPDEVPDMTRTLPVFSLDSGLFMERDWVLRGSEYLQTLEPRLYYLNIPYRDQSRLPNFDSALADFSYAQMFSENQFIGSDRINDANQLTAALTSRLLDPVTGQEWMRATIGQRYYFKEQQVVLPGGVARSDNSSDILATFSGRVTPAWGVDAGVQYNTGRQEFQKTGVGVRYQPETGKVLNLGYRFTRDALEQVDISSQWPIHGRWQGMGRFNYSFLDSKLLEGLAGLEYNGGCWAARVVMHQFASATAETSSSIFFQLELFGMGRIGSNPQDILKRNISGFSPTQQLSSPATIYEPY